MHEMGIAMQIVEISTSSIPRDLENPRVKSIHLKIGRLTAIVPDSLRFCFEIAARDTPFSSALLDIEEIPAVARCRSCLYEWRAEEIIFACDKCQSRNIEIVSGRELDIVSIEVDTD